MTIHLTIVEKACCEAAWRAAIERGPNQSPLYVDPARPGARRELARLVCGLPINIISSVILREIREHGKLSGGYSVRWEPQCLERPQHGSLIDTQRRMHPPPLSSPRPQPPIDTMPAGARRASDTSTAATMGDASDDDDGSTTQLGTREIP